jgi:fatty acid desaturase
MENDEDYRRARRRVETIKGFYVHLVIFVAVMIMLFVINLMTSPTWWVQWPLLGWGVGLAAHAAVVFGLVGFLGPDWEERKIKEFMARKPDR